jgi:hypothetical protein
MTQILVADSPAVQGAAARRQIRPPHARALYLARLERPQDAAEAARDHVRAWIEVARAESTGPAADLAAELAAELPADLPDSLSQLPGWI